MRIIKPAEDVWDASSVYDSEREQTQDAINAALAQEIGGKYAKPSYGIPAKDMADDVQSALAKASGVSTIYGAASGTTVFFNDGSEASLRKMTISIDPVQAEGTPTQETPLPISGWTGCNVFSGSANYENLTRYKTVSAETGDLQDANGEYFCSDMIPLLDNKGFYIKFQQRASGARVFARAYYDENMQFIPGSGLSCPLTKDRLFERLMIRQSSGTTNNEIPDSAKYIRFSFGKGVGTLYFAIPGPENHYYAFPSAAGTVYSGTLTVNSDGTGTLKVRPAYDSYNGEPLVGPWLSSMDVYEDGTTPTIGAQVVDLGGDETVYQLTEQEVINTLLGDNTIWADCGSISVEYSVDIKIYIDKKDDAIAKVERELVEYAGKGYLYWVAGTMNAEGKCYFSASTKYPVSNFVRISKIIRAYFSGDTFVSLYAYDSGSGYLGRVLENVSLSQSNHFAFSGELPIKEIKEKLPNVYYLRFVCPSATRMEAHDNLHITIKTTEDERLLDNARWMGTSDQAAPTPLALLHISDIHGNSSALHRINEKIDPYVNKINAKICTGDLVNNVAGQIDSWWDESIMTTIGNHDTRIGDDWTALSVADRIAYYISPFEENWGVVRGEGQSYYYKDFADAKVRLIVIDAMLYIPLPELDPDEPDAANDLSPAAQAQNEWLSNTMDEATNLGYHVLIAAHAPCRGATPFACSFTHAGRTEPYVGHRNTCALSESVVELVKAKITAGCNFVGYLVGHTHKDDIWQAPDDPRQFFFTITCATWSQTADQAREVDRSSADYTGSRSSWDYASGANYDAANLVTIDTSRSLIKIIRVGGADIDMYMRRRKAICIRYSDGTLMGEM